MILQWIVFFAISVSSAFGVTIEVTGENGEVLFKEVIEEPVSHNVGEISVDVFEHFEVDYVGDAEGILEIYGLAQKSEVVSGQKLKAYGWCFSVDGEVPDTLAHDTSIYNPSAHIKWFYGYALYSDGEWVDQCLVD